MELRATTRVDEQLHDRINSVAKRLGVSRSDVIRMGLNAGLSVYDRNLEIREAGSLPVIAEPGASYDGDDDEDDFSEGGEE